MDRYFGPEWDGEPFRLFDASHIGLLITVALLAALVIVVGPRPSERTKMIARQLIFWVLLIDTASWQVWNLAVGLWDHKSMLPLHLCSVMTLVGLYALWTRNRFAGVMTWLLGTPGALMALLTPEVAPFGFPHYRVIESWLHHGLLFLAGFWLVFAEDIRPTWKRFVQSWTALQVMTLVVLVINTMIGSNYLYVNRKPEFATILDALPEWPVYLVVLEAIVTAIMLAFWLMGRRWGNPSADSGNAIRSPGA